MELRYRINGINIDNSGILLSDTFGKLASMMQRHVIKDFSLVRTNLEQVFINFAKFQIQNAANGGQVNNENPEVKVKQA